MVTAAIADRKRQQREYDMRRGREASAAANEIGKLPYCHDLGRRKACGESLLEFLTRYFPYSTGKSKLGEDQIDVVERIQVVIQEEGWCANIMPRGFIKSTLSENAILWAILYGYRRYALFFAGTAGLAEKGLASIARELMTNELLLEDFPEACIPLRLTEMKPKRCENQTYQGKFTGMECRKDVLRLANIPGWEGAGAIIEAYGLLAPPRGARYKNELGENVRPDIGVVDDPSTDASAKSDTQNASRLRYIKNSISMMGGHGNEMAMIINATILNDGDLADQVSDPNVSPEIQSVRIPMIKKMPHKLDELWLGPYAAIRRNYDRTDPRGQIEAKKRSTEFLQAHWEEMHEGYEVAWENIGLESTELSALQHGLNILIDKGPDTFFAECQNQPLRPTGVAALEITEDVCERFSGFERYVIPNDTSYLVFGIDVHGELLYYTVAAVRQDFTGRVVHYGTFPDQQTDIFTLRTAKYTLSRYYDLRNKGDAERAIELGLRELIGQLLNREWLNANGQRVQIDCGLVDIGYKQTEVANAIRQQLPASRIVMQSRGIGIGATKKPMREYDLTPKRVLRHGPDQSDPRWIFPANGRDGSLYQVHFDTNFWKSVVASRLTQLGKEARWELFTGTSRAPVNHQLYVSHLMAESVDQVQANGRTVDQWELKSARDNHYWDTLVQCALAASLCGAKLPVVEIVEKAHQPIITTLEPQDQSIFKRDDGRDFFISARESLG